MRRTGHLYVKKDNGLYAVWSTIEDDFLADDLTLDQLKQYDMVTGIREVIRQSRSYFKDGKFERDMKIHKKTYDDLVELRKINHG